MTLKQQLVYAGVALAVAGGGVVAVRAAVEHYITGRIAAREQVLQKQMAGMQAEIDKYKLAADVARKKADDALAKADAARAMATKAIKEREALLKAVETATKRQEASHVEAAKVKDSEVRGATRASLHRLGLLAP
jgi:hypothetical protein